MIIITDNERFKYYLDKAFIDILLNSDYNLYMNDPLSHVKVQIFSSLFIDILNKYNEDESSSDYKDKKMIEVGELKRDLLKVLDQMKIEVGGKNEKAQDSILNQ